MNFSKQSRGMWTGVAFIGLLAASVLVLSSACKGAGGCDWRQQNFEIAPGESCIQPLADVCDATSGWLTLRNGCAQPLVIEYSAADGGKLDASPSNVTIAAGSTQTISVTPFGLHGPIQIPARLGSTPIEIVYDVVWE